jgi:transmembrane sensor
MPPDTLPSWDLIDRYLAGECTPEERQQIDAFLATGADAGSVLHSLRHSVVPEIGGAHPVTPALSLERFKRMRIDAPTPDQEGRPPRDARGGPIRTSMNVPRSRNAAWGLLGGAAVAGAVAMVLGYGFQKPWQNTIAPTRIYSTKPGQHATVYLADGSRAALGPATTLRVRTTLDGTHADVDGDVWFTVTHRPSSAFTVQTVNTTTRVLGTVFAVRHYRDDRTTRVLVTDGRVAVRQQMANTPHLLTANMMAIVGDSGQTRVVPIASSQDYTDWTVGRLVFKSAPMTEIVAELSRAYGTDIRLTDSVLQRRILTMTIPVAKRPLNDVLSALATFVGAHVTRSGDVLSIVPGAPTAPARILGPSPFTQESNYGR